MPVFQNVKYMNGWKVSTIVYQWVSILLNDISIGQYIIKNIKKNHSFDESVNSTVAFYHP